MKEKLTPIVGVTIADNIEKYFPILIAIIVCVLVIKIIMNIVRKSIRKSRKIQSGLYTFIEKAIKCVLYAIMVLIIADMLNIPISSLLATFSVVGLAVSLAIQDTLSNLMSGIVVLSTRPFKPGDYVDIGNVSGTVSEINFTHTVLTTIDNKIIRVPNKDVASATIVDYSESKERRVVLNLDVSYDNNSKEVISAIQEAVDATNNIMREKDIFIKMTDFKESSIKYTLRVWVKNDDYWQVYFDLLESIKTIFDTRGINIPYNQLDVHICK